MISEDVLRQATETLVAKCQPGEVILLGSHARGTADDRSDVDLLVVCKVSGSRRALMVAMDRAVRGFGVAREVLVLRPEEFEQDRQIPGTVARPAWLEGRPLYEPTCGRLRGS